MKKAIFMAIISVFIFSGCSLNSSLIEEEAKNVKNSSEKSSEVAYNFNVSENEMLLDDKENYKLVVFWATWCPACNLELPKIDELNNDKPDNLKIYTVNLTNYEEKGKAEVEKFIADNNFSFNVIFDEDDSISKNYSVRYIPQNYLIDKDGNIINKFNELEKEKLLELIK